MFLARLLLHQRLFRRLWWWISHQRSFTFPLKLLFFSCSHIKPFFPVKNEDGLLVLKSTRLLGELEAESKSCLLRSYYPIFYGARSQTRGEIAIRVHRVSLTTHKQPSVRLPPFPFSCSSGEQLLNKGRFKKSPLPKLEVVDVNLRSAFH
ncbi:unnamed protein product [Lactuca saligna]|uniref:Uncharacterized protein n=1 Tax=Lactuca saligna TaxID=75948 RepID=A0AA35VAI7_LACSI|nr:unnamed protein product [Lactuca saligna]